MSKTKLEYIWLDGYKPTQSLRSKTKIVRDFNGSLDDCPVWSFDGSYAYLLLPSKMGGMAGWKTADQIQRRILIKLLPA